MAFNRNIFDAIIGTRVRATNNDANKETTTVRARPRESFPAIPVAKNIGKNTATVVKVEAAMAPPTSLVPSIAARNLSLPSSM